MSKTWAFGRPRPCRGWRASPGHCKSPSYQKNVEKLQRARAATVKDKSWHLAPPPLGKEAVSGRPQIWRHRAYVGILQTTFQGTWKAPSCEPVQRWRGCRSRSRLWCKVLTWATRSQGPYGIGGVSTGKRHYIEFLARLLRFCHRLCLWKAAPGMLQALV